MPIERLTEDLNILTRELRELRSSIRSNATTFSIIGRLLNAPRSDVASRDILNQLRDHQPSANLERDIELMENRLADVATAAETIQQRFDDITASVGNVTRETLALSDAAREALRQFIPAGFERQPGTQAVPDTPTGRGSLEQVLTRDITLVERMGAEVGRSYARSVLLAVNEGRGVIVRRRNLVALEQFSERQRESAIELGTRLGIFFRDAILEAADGRGQRIIAQRRRSVAMRRYAEQNREYFRELGAGLGRVFREAIFDTADRQGQRIIRRRNQIVNLDRIRQENLDRFRELGTQIGRSLVESIEDAIQEANDRIRPLAEGLGGIGADILTGAAGVPGLLLQAQRDAAQARLEIEADLQSRLEAIKNNSELSDRQRARRIASAEEAAARQRAAVERQLSEDKREAYTSFIQDALRNLAQLIAAEVQAAVVRSTVAQIGSFVGPGLAALGTGGSIGVGIAAIAGLQLLANSFHNPANDAFIQSAGFQAARDQLFNDPQGFGQQSGRDVSRNYNTGFREGLQSDRSAGSVPTPSERQPVILQVDGRELGRIIIDLTENNIIPSLAT